MTVSPVRYRRDLELHEVPLPPGYERSILDPDNKRLERAEHEARIRITLERRFKINQRADGDAAYRSEVEELCRRDPIFFIDHFCWTYDDRIGEDLPLVLYPFQRAKIVVPYVAMTKTKGRDRMTLCKEKSRGVGFTWVELALRLWSWLFKDSWSTLIGAVTEDDVDDGGQAASHESLFGKLRYMLDHLPRWMRDDLLGPLWKHASYNKVGFLRNPIKPRNLIIGKHFGDMFGRGHRYSEAFGDEIAHAEKFKNADTSLKQTTNRFDGGSTPKGKVTFHYQLMRGELAVVRHTLHWSEHPELDLAWYNEQRQHMTDEAIAQELDIDYEGSAGARVLPEVRVATHFVTPRDPLPNVYRDGRHEYDGTLYDPGLPLHAIMDPGISDALACVWIQPDERRGEWRVVDFVQTNDRAIDWIVPFFIGHVPEHTHRGRPWLHEYNEVELQIIDRHRLWLPCEETFGDSYGNTRSMATGTSAWDELYEYGIAVISIKVLDDLQAIGQTQLWMRHVKVSGHLENQRNGPEMQIPTFAEVVSQWRYPEREEGKTPRLKPIHDKFCHGGDCLKMYASEQILPEATEQPVGSGRVKLARAKDVSVSKPYRPRR